MNLTRIWALVLRQLYLIRDNRTRLVQIFAWSTFDILLWGFLSKFLGAAVGASQFTPLFLGAIVVWNFTIRVMHGTATAFFEDVWSRNFLNIFASPITVGEYLASLVLTGVATAALGIAFMALLVFLFFGVSIFLFGSMLLMFLIILFITGVALGIMSVAIVLRFGPSAEWFIWPIPELIAPFIGVFYPIAVLPVWLQYLSLALPPTYVFEGVRAAVLGTPFLMNELYIGLVLSLVYAMLALYVFRRVYRRAVMGGLIARYSAESV